jgi:hypothetical protein
MICTISPVCHPSPCNWRILFISSPGSIWFWLRGDHVSSTKRSVVWSFQLIHSYSIQANVYSTCTCQMILNIRYAAQQRNGYPTLHEYEPRKTSDSPLEFYRSPQQSTVDNSVVISPVFDSQENCRSHSQTVWFPYIYATISDLFIIIERTGFLARLLLNFCAETKRRWCCMITTWTMKASESTEFQGEIHRQGPMSYSVVLSARRKNHYEESVGTFDIYPSLPFRLFSPLISPEDLVTITTSILL